MCIVKDVEPRPADLRSQTREPDRDVSWESAGEGSRCISGIGRIGDGLATPFCISLYS